VNRHPRPALLAGDEAGPVPARTAPSRPIWALAARLVIMLRQRKGDLVDRADCRQKKQRGRPAPSAACCPPARMLGAGCGNPSASGGLFCTFVGPCHRQRLREGHHDRSGGNIWGRCKLSYKRRNFFGRGTRPTPIRRFSVNRPRYPTKRTPETGARWWPATGLVLGGMLPAGIVPADRTSKPPGGRAPRSYSSTGLGLENSPPTRQNLHYRLKGFVFRTNG